MIPDIKPVRQRPSRHVNAGIHTLVITEQTESDGSGKDNGRQETVTVESTEFDRLASDKGLFVLDGLVSFLVSETEHVDYIILSRKSIDTVVWLLRVYERTRENMRPPCETGGLIRKTENG
jgi:hypothetical protein